MTSPSEKTAAPSAVDIPGLTDHLFRREAAKLVAVLTGIFGIERWQLAEDVVQEAMVRALQTWPYYGVPKNPAAWLTQAAKNLALDNLRREKNFHEKQPQIISHIEQLPGETDGGSSPAFESEIKDDRLRMMFVCCHPSVSEEGQVALILKTLCGFSVGEIANAFLTSEETITKRLYRAREHFREKKVAFEMPSPQDLQTRLDNVLTAIYLIFNEGYNSSYHDSIVREDLVEEALRLGKMLTDHPLTRQPESMALVALMCFQSARLPARVDRDGNLIQLKDQDRTIWNAAMIRLGVSFLDQASQGEKVSSYHLEAAIAHEHCVSKDYASTNWEKILSLYAWLYEMKPDPLIALNRLIAFGELHGPAAGLKELESFHDVGRMKNYFLYPAVLGEWHAQLGNKAVAKTHFEHAISLTNSNTEKQLLLNKIAKLG